MRNRTLLVLTATLFVSVVVIALAALSTDTASAGGDPPELSSWLRNTTGATGFNSLPANVQQVRYSDGYVYINSSGIPSYSIGPWPGNPNTASNQGYLFKIPRHPVAATGTHTSTPLGVMGVWKNGVPMFNALDAMSYQNQNIWHQNAAVVEGPSFDTCLGHPQQTGGYHHHQNPRCLYTSNASQHSPLLGYAYDGFPVYGPYGYANTNGSGGIRRITSSYRLRNITQRRTLSDGTQLSPAQYGPDVSAQYPLGYYSEDYEYAAGSGDLDQYNGRFSVTPEYPSGTYAYFVTINADNSSAYPYIIGPTYYGVVATENITSHGHVTVSETVSNYSPAVLQLGASGYAAGEGASSVSLIVTRTGDTTAAASIDYATSDAAGLNNCAVVNGQASSRCDYATRAGTLSFAASETSKTISIPLVDDAYAEGLESFTLTLSNPSNASFGTLTSATVSITDNDASPGTNPIVQTPFFVRQHYIDFLGREPDAGGYQGWQDILNKCAQGSTLCDRIEVSSAFFRSPEFQDRGYFTYRFYSAALGRLPHYSEFIPDVAKVSGFLSAEQLEANKAAFVQEVMSRQEFKSRYDSTLADPAAYVDALLSSAGVQLSQRQSLIDDLAAGRKTRGDVLRSVVESTEVYQKFYNEAFVVLQYFGYLRRDPDILYLNWIQTMNQTGDYRTMINGFMNSAEYVQRFGQ